MENTLGHGMPNLFVSPSRISIAKTCCHEPAHAAVHPERLLEALLRSHGSVDRHLPRVGIALMVRFCGGDHADKITRHIG